MGAHIEKGKNDLLRRADETRHDDAAESGSVRR
jgi:hypothetical protein